MTIVRQNFTALSIFLIFFLGLILLTGMISSGFHLKDDIDFVRTSRDIELRGLEPVVQEQISDILRIRLIPVQTLHEVLRCKFFGTNFTLWYIWSGFLVSFCAFFLYLTGRNIGFTFSQSLFLGSFTLLGQQGVCWFRFGTSEPIGMFFLSIALYFMAKAVSSEHRKKIYNALFIVFLLITTLCKESFILLIPALMLLRVWHYKEHKGSSFSKALTRNTGILVVLGAILIAELYIIFRFIGIEHEHMARVDRVGALLGFFKDPVRALRDFQISIFVLLEYITSIVILFGCYIVLESELGDKKSLSIKEAFEAFNNKLAMPLLISLLIILPQSFLYMKTGLRQRFWIPAILAFSFILTYLLKVICENKKVRQFSRNTFVVLVMLVFLPRIGHTVLKTTMLAGEGKATNALINKFIENADEAKNVLIVADPVNNSEWTYTFPGYINTKKKGAGLLLPFHRYGQDISR